MARLVNPKLGENVVDVVGDTAYYRLRLGRDKFTVTKRMGEHISGYVQELNIKRQFGFMSNKEYQQAIREVKNGLYKDIGRTNVLFENIVERTGIINVLLEGKVELTATGARSFKGLEGKLSDEQYYELQKLARNINIISRDRALSVQFYKDIDKSFKDLTNTYQQFMGHGGNLTKGEIDDLINTAKLINKMAEKYVR